MRKVQQQKILESLQTLQEVNNEIKKFFSLGKVAYVTQLLGNCQEFAVSVGTYIEELEGEGTRTVSLLEEYCKLLYEVNLAVSAPGGGVDDGIERLNSQLVGIEKSVREEWCAPVECIQNWG